MNAHIAKNYTPFPHVSLPYHILPSNSFGKRHGVFNTPRLTTSKSHFRAHFGTDTIDNQEIKKFSAWSKQWWDTNGPLKPLHHINPTRVSFIKRNIVGDIAPPELYPLKNVRILDLGCGAGILSEALSRLGAQVIGVDASKDNVQVAKAHALKDLVLVQNDLQYIHTTAEDLVAQGKQFDAVCSLEVIEHVADTESFVHSCCALIKPGGKLFISTLNRTLQSYLFGIIGAEYIFNLCGKGTHDWHRFVRPVELVELVNGYNQKNRTTHVEIQEVSGIGYNPITHSSWLTSDTSVNYIACFQKHQIK